MNNKKLLIGVGAFLGIIFLYTFLAGSCVFGHSWEEPTCLKPQTCSKCGKTTGTALGHEFGEATCEHGPKCSRCGTVVGEALEHQLSGATCTEAPKCELCGKNVGDALGHDIEYNNIIKAATCADDGEASGVCKKCGETLNDKIPATGEHTYIWDKDIPACIGGTHKGKCSICGFEKDEEVEGTGLHVFGEWFQSGTDKSGSKPMALMKRVCTICGEEEEKLEEIDYKQILTNNLTITKRLQNVESYNNKTYYGAEYTIKNNTDVGFKFVRIRITLLDGNNNAISSYSTYLSNGADLPAGETKQGSIKMPYEGTVGNIRLSVDEFSIVN